jgi:DHA2 family multidrug resistance protein-like MFS transporter
MNDTTREVGGALGIAVFGSIVNSGYRAAIDVGGLELPPGAAEQARESAGAAGQVAAQVGGQGGAALVDRAANAFTDAMNVTATISMVMLVVAALVVSRTFTQAKEAAAARASATELDQFEAIGSVAAAE